MKKTKTSRGPFTFVLIILYVAFGAAMFNVVNNYISDDCPVVPTNPAIASGMVAKIGSKVWIVDRHNRVVEGVVDYYTIGQPDGEFYEIRYANPNYRSECDIADVPWYCDFNSTEKTNIDSKIPSEIFHSKEAAFNFYKSKF